MDPPPRIQPVRSPDETQRALLAKTLATPDGAPLNVFATLAHRSALLRRINALRGYFFVDGLLSARQRELAILRTAGRLACRYELAQHRPRGVAAGLSPAEIEAAIGPAHAWS